MTSRRGKRYCCVFGCLNNDFKNPDLSLFKVPTESEIRLQWLRLIDREDLYNEKDSKQKDRICEVHFKAEDITMNSQRKRLKKDCLPCLRLPKNTYTVTPVPASRHSMNIQNAPPKLPVLEEPPIPQELTTEIDVKPVVVGPLLSYAMADCEIQLEEINKLEYDFKGSEAQLEPCVVLKKECDPLLNLRILKTETVEFEDPLQPTASTSQTDNQNLATGQKRKLFEVPIQPAASSSHVYTRKKSKISEQEEENMPEAKFHVMCQKYLTKDLAEIVKTQHYFKHRGSRNKSLNFKLMCLRLYYTSPQCYKIMKNVIGLPNHTTLNKLKIPLSTELNEDLMKILKIKVENMTPAARNCSVSVDTMELKPNLFYNISKDEIEGFHEVNGVQTSKAAKYAVVVVARGIIEDWVQPVGFAFLTYSFKTINATKINDYCSEWIKNVIESLLRIGLNVRAYVNDAVNVSKKIHSKGGNRSFININGHKIHYVDDVLHLMNLVRNNFMVADFSYLNEVAKFSDIVKFYEQDKSRTHKLAPKLTESHLRPTASQKTEVRYTAQLLSKTVAVGVSTYVDLKVIPESGQGTVRFLLLMNNLFDILNSSTLRHKNDFQKAFTGAEYQTKFLDEIKSLFKSLKFYNAETGTEMQNIKLFEKIESTIRAIELVFKDLKRDGFGHLFTRNLNIEPVTKFFEKIRTLSGKEEPTCRQFTTAYRELALTNIMKTKKEGTSAKDVSKFFLLMNDFVNIDGDDDSGTEVNTEYLVRDIKSADYEGLDEYSMNISSYLSSVLLKKCEEQHKGCSSLMAYMDVNGNWNNVDARTRFSKYQQLFGRSKADLPVPVPDDFISYVEKMRDEFRIEFEREHKKNKIGGALYERLTKIPFLIPQPCVCFPKAYLLKLFTRIHIYEALKHKTYALQNFKHPKHSIPS